MRSVYRSLSSKIPLHDLLLKHRQVIVEQEGRAPLAEKLAMKMFSMGASSAALYKMGSKMAPAAMSPFTSGNRVSKGVGPLKTGQIFVNSRLQVKNDSVIGIKIIRKAGTNNDRINSKP